MQFYTLSRHLRLQLNNINTVSTVHTCCLPFLIVLGWHLRVHIASLSSLALEKGNISPPQVAPQKTRLYLQRASSQQTISMQKHSPTFTMEYMRRQQRSFVAPVLLQICFLFFFFVIPEAVLLSCEDLRWGREWRATHTKEKGVSTFVSVSEKGSG